MSTDHEKNQSALWMMFSALVVGLTSIIVWILRIGSKPAEKRPASPPGSSEPVNVASVSSKTADAPAAVPRPAAQPATGAAQVAPHPGSAVHEMGVAPASQPAAVGPTTDQVEESTQWTAPTRYMAGAGILLFFLWLINYSQQSLTLLIFAALIAILAQPVTAFFQKRLRFSPGLAVVITYLLIAALLVALPVIVIPNIIAGINSLFNYDWQGILDGIAGIFDRMAAQVSTIPLIGNGSANSLESLSDFTDSLLTAQPQPIKADTSMTGILNHVGRTVGLLEGLIAPMVSGVLSLIFMLLISLQMSLTRGQIRGWILGPVPQRYKAEIYALLDRVQLVWVSFLRGQFALMVVMGVLVWLMNLLLGTPQAVLLGILAGFLEVIPSLGPTLATIPAAIFALLFGSNNFPGLDPLAFMLIVILGYILLNLVENQVLVPQILGEAVSLPPLIVLIGVMIAGTKAGIVGVFLATPMIATAKELLTYIYRKVLEKPEEGPPEEDKPSLLDQVRGFIGRIRLPIRRAGRDDTAVPQNSEGEA